MAKLGCEYCKPEQEPGWIELDDNGPIVPCPICNPMTQREYEYERAQRQRRADRLYQLSKEQE